MDYLQRAIAAGMEDALGRVGVKLAARRAKREARAAAAAGDMAKAQRIMQAPGVVSDTSSGVPYKDLGAGNEGVAQLAIHPKMNGGNPVVKKTFNPAAQMYSPELIANKERMAPATNQNDAFAKLYGASRTSKGVPVHYGEYVPGTSPKWHADGDAIEKAQRAAARVGVRAEGGRMKLQDVRPANMQRTADGQVKIIDHLPMHHSDLLHPDEIKRLNLPENVIPVKRDAMQRLLPNVARMGQEHEWTSHEALAAAHGGVDPWAQIDANKPKPKGMLTQMGEILSGKARPEPKPVKVPERKFTPKPMADAAPSQAASTPAPAPAAVPAQPIQLTPAMQTNPPAPAAAPAPAAKPVPTPAVPTPAAPARSTVQPLPSSTPTSGPATGAAPGSPMGRLGWGHAAGALGAAGLAYGGYKAYQHLTQPQAQPEDPRQRR